MKTNLDSLYKLSDEVMEQGVDLVITETLRFRVTRFSDDNPKIKKALTKYFKPFARQIEMGTLSDKQERSVYIKVFSESSLISWEGVEFDGVPAECNQENSIKLFNRLPELFKQVLSYAQDFKNFKEDFEEQESEEALVKS